MNILVNTYLKLVSVFICNLVLVLLGFCEHEHVFCGVFCRRQVLWIAKQILQLGMGDAFDDWLIARIQWLRREEVVASGIYWLKGVSIRIFHIV